MKTKHLLAPLAVCCAVTALVGCVSTDRQIYESSLDGMNLQRDEALSPTGLSQPVILDESAFRKLDLDTNGAITFDEWQRFDASAGSKENFRALDENRDGVINATEFVKQAPKHSAFFSCLGSTNDANDTIRSRDEELSGQKRLRHFSLPLFEVNF